MTAVDEIWWRLGAFTGIFAVMAALETALPRRQRSGPGWQRWLTNLALSAFGVFLLRLMAMAAVPIAAVAAAEWARTAEVGIFRLFGLPAAAEFLLTLLALDLALYIQHWASHKIPLFWRLHRVHHADVEFDVSTGVRFHPFEIALSMIYKAAIVIALGAEPLAVFVFEIVLNGTSLFNHSNLAIPAWLDRVLRCVIVTPDMHRVHHSALQRETDSNFGFNFSIWDFIFKTYVAQPRGGHTSMKIGIERHQDENPRRLIWSLLYPFKKN